MDAILSLPKKNPEEGKRKIKEFISQTAGRVVLLSDGGAASVLAGAGPRTISVVLTGRDALPLFAVSEGAGGIVAAGGETVMRIARWAAGLLRVRCLLFPTSAALDGVYERRGNIFIDGVSREFPLAEGEPVLDFGLLRPSFGEGYARLRLARLACFERRALSLLEGREENGEAAYSLLARREAYTEREVLETNRMMRLFEDRGLSRGEGSLGHAPALSVYRGLFALYTAFFERGKPRREIALDYRGRATRAGVPYGEMKIPSAEEYARRALRLERFRGVLLAELGRIAKEDGAHMRAMRAIGPLPPPITKRELSLLSDRTDGLSRIIRDFGLLENV